MLYKVVTLYYYSTFSSSESGMFETKWRLIRKSAQFWQSHGKNMGEWKHFVLTIGAVGKILNCDHWKPLSSTLLWYCWLCCIKLFQRLGCGWHIVLCEPSDESYWAVRPCNAVYFFPKKLPTFESVDEILTNASDHSNESYWAVLFCGIVYYAAKTGSNFVVWGWNRLAWPVR